MGKMDFITYESSRVYLALRYSCFIDGAQLSLPMYTDRQTMQAVSCPDRYIQIILPEMMIKSIYSTVGPNRITHMLEFSRNFIIRFELPKLP